MKYEEYIMKRKSYLVVEESLVEWKLCDDLHQIIIPCVV